MLDGVVVVCRLEQIHANGVPLPAPYRWSLQTPSGSSLSFTEIASRLLRAQAGHFRVIAFAVTDAAFRFGDPPSMALAEDMVFSGAIAPGPELESFSVSARYSCFALVYEFIKREGAEKAEFIQRGQASASEHLLHSRITSPTTETPI